MKAIPNKRGPKKKHPRDIRVQFWATIKQGVIDDIGVINLRKEIHAHFENETTLKKLINQK